MKSSITTIWVVVLSIGAVMPSAHAETQKECQNKLLRGEASGLVKGYRNDGRRLVVIVDERIYAGIQYSSKLGLAMAFECAIAGPGKALREVTYQSGLTNKVLATWYLGQLTVE
jgi:hypothetical protein